MSQQNNFTFNIFEENERGEKIHLFACGQILLTYKISIWTPSKKWVLHLKIPFDKNK